MSANNVSIPSLHAVKTLENMLEVVWSDGQSSRYHYLWLRDNCPSNLHPDTKERVFDLLSVSEAVHPTECHIEDNLLVLHWSEGQHTSQFENQWLRENAYSGDLKPSNKPRAASWDAQFVLKINHTSYHQLINDDEALCRWMQQLDKDGLVVVQEMPSTAQALDDFAHRIDYQRQTNFGVTFEVRSEPNPINLAYTSLALPLHTDLANQETPPGYQFLHCLVNDATGGESVFADGVKVLEDMREENPEHFSLLSTVAVPFRFHDKEHDIEHHHPLINLDHKGNIVELKYNAHLASIYDLPEETMHDYYLAYRDLMARMRDDKYRVQFRLQAGDMAVFDNRRVLHGRAEFEPNGHRHLRGCYVDRTEFQSRLRVLEQRFG